MSADDPIEQAAQAVADGASVDWGAFDRGDDDSARDLAANLKIVEAIAAAHRASSSLPSTVDVRTATGEIGVGADAGSRWGRYTLRREVGGGTFGAVYRAWDPMLECDIAIKILYADAATDAVKQRLLAEARALAKVKHPNVVKVLGVE